VRQDAVFKLPARIFASARQARSVCVRAEPKGRLWSESAWSDAGVGGVKDEAALHTCIQKKNSLTRGPKPRLHASNKTETTALQTEARAKQPPSGRCDGRHEGQAAGEGEAGKTFTGFFGGISFPQ